jgi:hypothetical protein
LQQYLDAVIDDEERQEFRQAAKDGGVDTGREPQRFFLGLRCERDEETDQQPDGQRGKRQGYGDLDAEGDFVAPAGIAAGDEGAVSEKREETDRSAEVQNAPMAENAPLMPVFPRGLKPP